MIPTIKPERLIALHTWANFGQSTLAVATLMPTWLLIGDSCPVLKENNFLPSSFQYEKKDNNM